MGGGRGNVSPPYPKGVGGESDLRSRLRKMQVRSGVAAERSRGGGEKKKPFPTLLRGRKREKRGRGIFIPLLVKKGEELRVKEGSPFRDRSKRKKEEERRFFSQREKKGESCRLSFIKKKRALRTRVEELCMRERGEKKRRRYL